MSPKLLKFLQRHSKHYSYSKRIAKFIFENYKLYVGSKNLYKIFGLYEKWVLHSEYRSLPFEMEVLHYIVERTFWSAFGDSEYISKLLSCLYIVETHLGYIFCPGSENFPLTVGRDYSAAFVKYFLDHANKMRIVFNGRRIFDIPVSFQSVLMHPCEAAVRIGSPELLLVLLQHGALATDQTLATHQVVCTHYIQKTIIRIVYNLQELRQSRSLTDDSHLYASIVACGKLMARVCPQIGKKSTFTKMLTSCQYDRRSTNSDFMEKVMRRVTTKDLPQLESRIFAPMPLKQACRLRIRKTLYDNWQLPDGIKELPVPEIIKSFLNLYID